MNRTEIAKLITMCSLSSNVKWPEPGKLEDVIDLWLAMFGNVSYEVGSWAVTKYINESPFPPTVADIRKRITDITVKQGKTAIDAWGEVKLAIRRYGMYREREALESMSESVRGVVTALGYSTLCMSDNDMADRAHFLKVYDTLQQRKREDAALMPGLRKAMDRLQGGDDTKKLGNGEGW